jgi:hypothetical protein
MRIAQQLRHKRIGVGDFSGTGIENEDAVPGGFKQAAVTNLGCPRDCCRRPSFGFGDGVQFPGFLFAPVERGQIPKFAATVFRLIVITMRPEPGARYGVLTPPGISGDKALPGRGLPYPGKHSNGSPCSLPIRANLCQSVQDLMVLFLLRSTSDAAATSSRPG